MITGRDLIERLYSEEEQEERTYSVEMDEETLSLFSDFFEEQGVDLKLFSKDRDNDDKEDKKGKKHRISLDKVNSNRGLGRSMILGAVIPGAVGGYAGKKAAEKADKEGKSDREIVEAASDRGMKVGAAVGGGLGLAHTLRSMAVAPKGYVGRNAVYGLGRSAIIAGAGALGGYLGAKKNTKRRLEKRAYLEKEDNED